MYNSSALLAHSAMFSPAPQIPSAPGAKKKLIYDQDHRGPLSTDTVRDADAPASRQHRPARHLHRELRHVGQAGNRLRAASPGNHGPSGSPGVHGRAGSSCSTPRPKRKCATRCSARGRSATKATSAAFAKDAPGRDELDPAAAALQPLRANQGPARACRRLHHPHHSRQSQTKSPCTAAAR